MLQFKVERVGSIAKVQHPEHDIQITGDQANIYYKDLSSLSEEGRVEPVRIVEKLLKIMEDNPTGVNKFTSIEKLS